MQVNNSSTSYVIAAKLIMVVSLLTMQGTTKSCDALRMINLDVPEIALQGDTIQLSCSFRLKQDDKQIARTKSKQELEQDERTSAADTSGAKSEPLYAIKWYKDGREFYRYLAQDWPRKQWLPAEGVLVDIDKSDNHTVVLRAITLKTTGSYKCEVSTDAPDFLTKSIERRMLVYALPNRGPVIEVIRAPSMNDRKSLKYFLNDKVELTCTSAESKPPSILDWIIGDNLNLSSTDSSSLYRPGINPLSSKEEIQYNFSASRFVKLPNFSGAINSIGFKNTKAVNSKQTPPVNIPPVSYQIYVIQNGSMAVPYVTASDEPSHKPVAINLTGSLDKLAETSTIRLNFTVDANLFLDIKQSKTQQARSARDYLSQNANSSAGAQDIRESPTILHASNRKQRFHSNRTHSSRQVEKIKSTNHDRARGRILNRSRSNDREIILKIKCTARVLHLTMSDDIELILTDEERKDKPDESFGAEMIKRTNSDNSGCFSTHHRLTFPKVVVIIVLGIMFLRFG